MNPFLDSPAINIQDIRVIFPSSFRDSGARLDLGLRNMEEWETALRIGHGHDLLVKLRGALGVKSYLSKHQTSNARGYAETGRVGSARTRAGNNVKLIAKLYRVNWAALVTLGMTDPEKLKGLQPLQDADLAMLSSWLEEGRYRTREALPWVWKLESLVNNNVNSEDVADRIRAWNTEGHSPPSLFFFALLRFILKSFALSGATQKLL